jgi:transposase-like protein
MKVYQPRLAKGLSMKKRRRHTPEQIVKKLRDADAMLTAGKSIGEVLQAMEVSEATLARWRSQYGGMKSEEAKRLKMLEEENSRLKKIVGDQALDIQMLKEIAKGN